MKNSMRLTCRFAAVLGVMLLTAAATFAQVAPAWNNLKPEDHIGDELLIVLENGFDAEALLGAKNKALDGTMRKRFKRLNAVCVKLPADKDVRAAAREYEKMPGVLSVEPNTFHYQTLTPDDVLLDSQWGMARINAEQAWDVCQGSSNVVVGIIDSGIDLDHPDLATNIWVNPGEDLDNDGVITEADRNGLDDDGNGYEDDFHGWDFEDLDNDPSDENLHGTHVAGTVGAVGNNGIGVVGVNWQVKLASIKIFGTDAELPATTENIALAIEYCVMMGFPISNNSWGGGPPSFLIEAAIAAGGDVGHLFVAAAGNNGRDIGANPFYPAGFFLDNIISVGAINVDGNRANFSNFNPDVVDIGAPGVQIWSTFPDPPTPDSLGIDPLGEGYAPIQGTSMASPHVAGTAAWLLSVNPCATMQELKDAIIQGGRVNPSLQNSFFQGRELDMVGALDALPKPFDVDSRCYRTNETIAIFVEDCQTGEPSVDVFLQWGTNSAVVTIPEAAAAGEFEGSQLISDLVPLPEDGDILTLSYTASWGRVFSEELTIDLFAPEILSYDVVAGSDDEGFYFIKTDEPVDRVVTYIAEMLPVVEYPDTTVVSGPEIQPDGTTQYVHNVTVHNLEPGTAYWLGFEVIDCARNSTSVPANLASLNENDFELVVTRIRRTKLFSDFDNGTDNWTSQVLIGTNEVWQHGVPDFGPFEAASPPNAWGTVLDDRYPKSVNAVVTSPSIELKDFPRIEFDTWFKFPVDPFFGIVDDDGVFVEFNQDELGWSNATQRLNISLPDHEAIRGEAPFWQTAEGSLLGLVSNSSTRVRFRLETDSVDVDTGFFFDNVKITDLPFPGLNVFEYIVNDDVGGDGDGFPEPGETFTLRLFVFNSNFEFTYEDVTLVLDAIDSGVSVVQDGPAPIGRMEPADVKDTAAAISVTLAPTIANETVLTFFANSDSSNASRFTEDFQLLVGVRETITGTVTEIGSGGAVPVAQAFLTGVADGYADIRAITNPDGTYEMHGGVPGVAYTITAMKAGEYSAVESVTAITAPATGIDFELGQAFANAAPTDIFLEALEGQTDSANVGLDNGAGSVAYDYTAVIDYEDPFFTGWLTVDPNAASTPAGDTNQFVVVADSDTLPIGQYNATIRLVGNDIDGDDVEIPVSFSVNPGPDLTITRVLVEGGDGDEFAEAGETVELIIQLANRGALTAIGPTGELRVINPTSEVAVVDATCSWPDIEPLFSSDPLVGDSFSISISTSIVEGTSMDFQLDVTTLLGGNWSLPFSITSDVRHAVSGTIFDGLAGGAAGVSNAIIRADGPVVVTALSDANGFYNLTGLVAGDYEITVDPPVPFSRPVAANLMVTQDLASVDFVLGTWDIAANPTSITVTVSEGADALTSVNLSNLGTVDGTVDLITESRFDLPNNIIQIPEGFTINWEELTPGVDYIAGEFLVTYRQRTPLSNRFQALASVGAQALHTYRTVPTTHVKVAGTMPMREVARRLEAHPDVLLVEPNWIRRTTRLPNDPFLSTLYGLKNERQTGGTRSADIGAETVWDTSIGSHEVLLAINDSGVDILHQDLAANIYSNVNEGVGDRNLDGFPGIVGVDDDGDAAATAELNVLNGLDDDGDGLVDETGIDFLDEDIMLADYNTNGIPLVGPDGQFGTADDDTNDYVFAMWDDDENGLHDDINGWDFGNMDNDPIPDGFDGDDHGTHVAGTAGAVGDNREGIVGVNWNVTILPIKLSQTILDPFTGLRISILSADAILKGIEYCEDRGAQVSNHSYGGGAFSPTERMMIKNLTDSGHLFVAAAGNSSVDNDADGSYPASYDLERIISVAAADHNHILASFSNYGLRSVDLAAPGVDVFSTITEGFAEPRLRDYGFKSGTSMASPHVAGAAALLLSIAPNATPDMLKSALMDGSRKDPRLADFCVSSGHLDLQGAVDRLLPFWVVPSEDRVTIAAGTSTDVELLFNAGKQLVAGEYKADLFVTEDRNNIRIPLTLNVTAAPAPIIEAVVVDDSVTGDGDGLAEPGETVVLDISLFVTGSAFYLNPTGILSAVDVNAPVTVSDAQGAWGSGLSGSTLTPTDSFQVAFDPGASGEIEFVLTVGNATFDPVPLTFSVNVEEFYSVLGQVQDAQAGTGIADVRVEYWGNQGGTVTADSLGNYRIDGLTPGDYKIRALPTAHEKSDPMLVSIGGSDQTGMNIPVGATEVSFSAETITLNIPAGRTDKEVLTIANAAAQQFNFDLVEYPNRKIVIISDANQLDGLSQHLEAMGFDVETYSENYQLLEDTSDPFFVTTYLGGQYSEDSARINGADLVIADLTGPVGYGRSLTEFEVDAFNEYLARGKKLILTGANVITRPDNLNLNEFVSGESLERATEESHSAMYAGSLSVNRFVELMPGEVAAITPQEYDIIDSASEVLFEADASDKIVREASSASDGVTYVWNGNKDGSEWVDEGVWLDTLRNIVLEELGAPVDWLNATPANFNVTDGSIDIDLNGETAGLDVGTYNAVLLVNGNYPGTDVRYINVVLNVTPLNLIAQSVAGVVDWLDRPLEGDGSEQSDFLQLINAGPNGVIDPPESTGAPGGDDYIIQTSVGGLNIGRFGQGFAAAPDLGRFSIDFNHNIDTNTNPRNVYVRAWDGKTILSAVAYGESELHGLQATTGEVHDFGRWVVGSALNYPGPNAKDFNGDTVPDGYYIANGGDPRLDDSGIETVDAPFCEVGSFGLEDRFFKNPSQVVVADHYFFVLDTGNNRIQSFNRDTEAWVMSLGTAGTGPGQFSQPYGMAKMNGTDELVVLDTGNGRVQVISFDSATGMMSYDREFKPEGFLALNGARGIATDLADNIYIADRFNDRIQIFDAAGNSLIQFGTAGAGLGFFQDPEGIDVDENGVIYVTDSANHRVQVLNGAGVALFEFGSFGNQAGQFSRPTDITVGTGGFIYVSDTSNSRIQVFDKDRNFVTSIAENGPLPGEFAFQRGLFTVDGTSTIYVADTQNHRIQCFSPIFDGDEDGLDDVWEFIHGLDFQDASDAGRDDDGDGIINLGEYRIDSDPNSGDTDGDGVSEGMELAFGSDPLDPTSSIVFISEQRLLTSGAVELVFSATLGETYQLQENADLTNDNGWADLMVPGTPLTADATGNTVITIPDGVFDPVKHYRIVVGGTP